MYWKSQLGMQGPLIEAANRESLRQTTYSDVYQRIELKCPVSDTLIMAENYYPDGSAMTTGRESQFIRP